jgi:hypothetical protein
MPIIIESIVLCLLSVCWLAFHGHVTRSLSADIYHVAAEKRDAKKGRFYYISVWIGLIAAFLSARSLEALSTAAFDSSAQRSWVLGSLRGMEMWGLLIVGAVWIRVGQRISQPNFDGTSLTPAGERQGKHKS